MVTQNLGVLAYIALRYNSAAEATELLSSVASLAIKVKYIFTSISLLEFNSVDLELI